jgi:hypothetical protein
MTAILIRNVRMVDKDEPVRQPARPERRIEYPYWR